MTGLARTADGSPRDGLSRPHLAGCLRTRRELLSHLRADLHRYAGRSDAKSFWRHFLFTPGFSYTVWMRTCGYLKTKRWARALLVYYVSKFILMHLRYKYGIAIPEYTRIGPGLFINRFGGIMVNGDAVIGANCNLTHGAMLGQANRGPRAGSPILGDRVFLAAGAKVIGRVRLGDGCVVGANAVVTRDVAPNAVMVGIPAQAVSHAGSEGYVNNACEC